MTSFLLENGPVVLFLWKDESLHRVEYVSPNVEKVLGLSYASFLSKQIDFIDIVHPQDKEQVCQQFKLYIKLKTPSFNQLYKILNAKNEIVWVHGSIIVDYDSDSDSSQVAGYFINITDQKNLQNKNYQLAYYDTMTGLPNRQKMQIDMQSGAARIVVVFNIDDFKEMNDLFGLSAGDELLRQIGEWFKKSGYSPYRISGDEFALFFLEERDLEAIRAQITESLLSIEEEMFYIQDEIVNIRMSVGIAIGKERLLAQADIALHVAKNNKMPFAFYDENDNIEEKYRTNIEMARVVRQALSNNRILCHYQPIKDLQMAEIKKYETLVRLLDENGEIIFPDSFLFVAKKTKLCPQITCQVVEQACKAFSTRQEQFSINLSIGDIQNTHTAKHIIDTIISTKTASRIVFEILESEGIEKYSEIENFISTVKSLGAKIAIDDFGTGYSNFEKILKLNIDYIKLDGSLIRNIVFDSRKRIIVETIVAFAKKIGLKTIAEYVSDIEVYGLIKEMGVDYAQGYYIGKPQPLP